MSRAILVVVIFGTFFSNECRSEPTPEIRWLMDEPASLFDIGMMRMRFNNKLIWIPKLEEQIRESGLETKESGVGGVVYDWKENTIGIDVSFIGETDPTESQCTEILAKYKKIISRLPKENSLRNTLLAGSYSHINYSIVQSPRNLDEAIVGLMKFSVGIRNSRNDRSIFCASDIDSPISSFKKFGDWSSFYDSAK